LRGVKRRSNLKALDFPKDEIASLRSQ